MATPRSSSRGSNALSRNFTDSERALDDRISSHLEAPPIQWRDGNTLSQSYKWLADDLSLRSKLSSQLAQEQQMAYAQSTRHELAEQADKQDSEDQAALGAFKQVNALLAQGVRKSDAIAQVTAENDGLALNKRWGEISKDQTAFGEDDDTRDLREANEELARLGVGAKKFDLEMADKMRRENPELMDQMIATKMKEIETQGVTAANAGVYAHLEQIKRQKELDDLTATSQSWGTLAAGISDDPAVRGQQFEQLAPLRHSFSKAGLGGVLDPVATVKTFGSSPTVMSMLSNKSWIASKLFDPAAKEAFVAAINTINDTSEGADPQRKAEAQNLVLDLAGEHQDYIASSQAYDARMKDLGDISKDQLKAYSDVSDSITKILSADAKMTKATDKPALIGGEADAFIDQFRLASSGKIKPEFFDEFKTKIQRAVTVDTQTEKAPDARLAAAEVRKVLGEFAKEYKKTFEELPGADPKKAVGTPDLPGAPPVGTVRGGYTFTGGDPALESSWRK